MVSLGLMRYMEGQLLHCQAAFGQSASVNNWMAAFASPTEASAAAAGEERAQLASKRLEEAFLRYQATRAFLGHGQAFIPNINLKIPLDDFLDAVRGHSPGSDPVGVGTRGHGASLSAWLLQ